MGIFQYVSGKRDKLNNDCANKIVLENEIIRKFILYFRFYGFYNLLGSDSIVVK